MDAMQIHGCPLPDLTDANLARLCALMSSRIWNQLDPGQKQHLGAYSFSGNALRALAGRLLSRMIVLRVLPGARICMDANGRTILEGVDAAIAFSHTQQASFCAILYSPQDCQFGIDAECGTSGDFADYGVLKSWLALEAGHKAAGKALTISALRSWNAGCRKIPPSFYLRYLAFPAHLLCVACSLQPHAKPLLCWHHYLKIIRNQTPKSQYCRHAKSS